MVYPTYQLDCKNTGFRFGPHHIEVPFPSQVTLGGVTPSRDHIRNVAFACPLCQHVYEYDGAELRHRVLQAERGELPAIPIPVRVRIRCHQPDCGASVAIYTTRHPAEQKETVLTRLRASDFHTRCENGHALSFPSEEGYELAEGPLCNPF